MSKKTQRLVTHLLSLAEIQINGPHPWDVRVNNDRFYSRVLHGRELGIGESYMDGDWDCHAIDELVSRLLRADLHGKVKLDKKFLLSLLANKLMNLQSKRRAFIVGKQHYDIGNPLYKRMLDHEMNYSCAYWKNADTLEKAQFDKLDLICKKLQLKPGMRLLDIGCGWGSMARHAARHYGVTVTGVTISREQKSLADELNQGLPIEIRLQDYRELTGTFDRVVSIGMFEHVGIKNYRSFFNVVHRVLDKEGLCLLHTIADHHSLGISNPWITKYIFPNGALPAIHQIARDIDTQFVMEDWHNFGADYDRTLMAWYDNFVIHWPDIQKESPHYNERFFRMWKYYLLSCAGCFRARNIQLWQIVLSKNGLPGGYTSVR